MSFTYELIAKNTLTSSAASVTFSSIPNTFTDLLVKISARETFSDIAVPIRMSFNGDSATNYSWTELVTINGTSATSGRVSNSAGRLDSYAAAANTATASTFGNTDIYIPNYLASANKPVGTHGNSENNATAVYLGVTAGLWRNTAAITSITFTAFGNYVSGSSFFLYGIKNS